MPRILLTGFEPFDRDTVNPSWEVARALDGWQTDGATVQALQLPCVFGAALARLDQALDAGPAPVLVVGLGLAGGRAEITPERIAINVDDARIPDNAGRQPVDAPVAADGPAAYFSTLPIKAMVHALRAQGLPASVSNTAGTFVCNHLFYGLMHRLATRADLAGTRGGFVHVPALPAQAARLPGMPCLPLETQVQALRVLLRTALAVRQDIAEAGGALH
ncbi:pyroglutamyl-peptidase I [uncultured Pseudacidovorax sp.]|uniref:pyroglutamyl-peptidase I n=1 Tax=uncultured Pseudacidovorax sp. TaxID=679313 RepID=UPI0025E69548|nr:pyroglutamyl-peptidase I [uncultured Pseudacidovorax sp.]